MNKKNIEISEGSRPSFPPYISYSIAEIMATGGTTAFANKMGKSPESLEDSLQKLPEDALLTDEDVLNALQLLKESK